MDTTELVIESLGRAAELNGDPAKAIYQRYYAACPESGELMAHVDMHMQGRMLTEVFRLLMADDATADEAYLHFETRNHEGYGVKRQMYTNLLTAVRDTVRSTLGEEWREEYAVSWNNRIDALLGQLDSALSRA